MSVDPWLTAIDNVAAEVALQLATEQPTLDVWELYEALWNYEGEMEPRILAKLPDYGKFGRIAERDITFQRFRAAVSYYYARLTAKKADSHAG